MAYRMIVKDIDILRKRSRQVDRFDSRLHTLLDDMKETMYKSDGVGLAAVQGGILKRVVVIDCGDDLIELINPEIIATSESQVGQEGCLSFPGRYEYVERPRIVTVKAQDRNGNWFERTGEDLLARAFCHELDHLDGKVFLDFIMENPPEEDVKSKKVNARLKKKD